MNVSEQEFILPRIGDLIGSVRVLDTIALGGMAIVYKVKHEDLEVFRAIKLLKPGFTEDSRQRLQTEAKIAAHLHHPNITQIYNVSVWNNNPYIEMEFVDGFSLFDLLTKRGHFPITVVLAMGIILSKALAFAHQQVITVYGKEYRGLVHRDIKPANILISHKGILKLADFGIALPGSESIHTTDASVMGTGPYISPEQIDGEKLDARSDIYSLGTVLYEITTGERAFPQKKMSELMRDKIHGHYIPATDIRRGMPKEMAETIATCISVNRSKRFRSAQELADVLNRIYVSYSTDSPEKTIVDHISGKQECPPTVLSKTWAYKRRMVMSVLRVGIFIIIGIALILSVILFLSRTKRPSFGTQQKTSSTALVHNNKEQQQSYRIPMEQPTSLLPLATDSTKPPVRRNDSLSQALRLFDKNDFSKALSLLENALTKVESDKTRLALLISLVELEKFDYAQKTLAEKELLDGWYLYVSGRVALSMGNTQEATSWFNKALNARFSYFPNRNGKEASALFNAKSSQIQFLKKPNKDNRTTLIAAWKYYLSNYCTSSENASVECAKGQLALDQLKQ